MELLDLLDLFVEVDNLVKLDNLVTLDNTIVELVVSMVIER